MLDYPNYSPQKGDKIVAARDLPWGHLKDYFNHVSEDDTIVIEFGDRLPQPKGRGTFEAEVNGEDVQVHIDFVTDVFQAADQLTLTRY